MLFLVIACVPEHPVRTPSDAPVDAGEPIDTGETADTLDSADTMDTVDTAPLDTGSFHADVVYVGAESTVDCGGGTGVFVHTFVDAMGNVAGEATCTADSGDTVRITFTAGAVGAWTEPGAVDLRWTSAAGETLYWGAPGTMSPSWSVAFTTFERTSTNTIDLVGTFGAVWTDEAGTALGTVTGDVVTTLTCDACP